MTAEIDHSNIDDLFENGVFVPDLAGIDQLARLGEMLKWVFSRASTANGNLKTINPWGKTVEQHSFWCEQIYEIAQNGIILQLGYYAGDDPEYTRLTIPFEVFFSETSLKFWCEREFEKEYQQKLEEIARKQREEAEAAKAAQRNADYQLYLKLKEQFEKQVSPLDNNNGTEYTIIYHHR